MKTVSKETFEKIINALNSESAYVLFNEKIGSPEDHLEDEPVALMWDLDTEKLMILDYANPSNGWAKVSENQNPWVHLGYVSASDCAYQDPFSDIAEKLEYLEEQKAQ